MPDRFHVVRKIVHARSTTQQPFWFLDFMHGHWVETTHPPIGTVVSAYGTSLSIYPLGIKHGCLWVELGRVSQPLCRVVTTSHSAHARLHAAPRAVTA